MEKLWPDPLLLPPDNVLGELLLAQVVIERKAEFLPRWIAQQEEQLRAMQADLADFCKKHGIKQLPD